MREGIELECSTTIGYRHGEDTPVPEQLAALMDSLHQQGLSRLVLEMNARQHEVLERALKGDLQAQNEVNSGSAEDRSRWWNRLAGSKLSLSRQICLARGGEVQEFELRNAVFASSLSSASYGNRAILLVGASHCDPIRRLLAAERRANLVPDATEPGSVREDRSRVSSNLNATDKFIE